MDKQFLYSFYLGADNETGECDKRRIESIFGSQFLGFTLYEVDGFWCAVKEKSIKVEVLYRERMLFLQSFIDFLKQELKQECILVTVQEVLGECL